jgi:hypothetical protein
VPYWNVAVAWVSSVPLSVADDDVTLVAGAVVIVASAVTVARSASIASIEHSGAVGDAVGDAVPTQARLAARSNCGWVGRR